MRYSRIHRVFEAKIPPKLPQTVSVLTDLEENMLTFREGNAGAQLEQVAFFERQGAFHLGQMQTQQVA